MIELTSPEIEVREVSLAVEARRVKGVAAAPAMRSSKPASTIGIGAARAVPITVDFVKGDSTLAQFVAAEAHRSDFYLVHLALTFKAAEHEAFATATVELEWASLDGKTRAPIAWSMRPEKIVDEHELTRSFKLAPKLKFAGGVEGEIEAGLETKTTERELFIESLNPMTARPAWEFHANSRCAIRGAYFLDLIVETEKGAAATGEVTIKAELERTKLALIVLTSRFEGAPRTTVVLP